MTAASMRAGRVVVAAAAQANLTRGERIPPIRSLGCKLLEVRRLGGTLRGASTAGRLGQLDCALACGRFGCHFEGAIRTGQTFAAGVGTVGIRTAGIRTVAIRGFV